MTRTNTTKKLGLRRFATLLAASGMLVMSSGVALLVSAPSANAAATKVIICHATNSDTNPYTYNSVDDDSVKFKGHLKHRQDPNKIWKTAGTFNGVPHTAGQAKPDLISDFVDDGGTPHVYDGVLTKASCEGEVASLEAVADVDFTDPSCANANEVSYDTNSSDGVTFAITDGSVTAGESIEITATAPDGSKFEGDKTTQVFTHVFGPLVNLEGAPCVIVNPPTVATASVDFVDPSCLNGNEASYEGTADNATFEITDGSEAAGSSIEVTATATGEAKFADDTTTAVFTHDFGDAVDLEGAECVGVIPPVVEPPIATPTLVHAGLAGNVAPDLRNEQGMALLAAGMLLMIAAGGFGLRAGRR